MFLPIFLLNLVKSSAYSLESKMTVNTEDDKLFQPVAIINSTNDSCI